MPAKGATLSAACRLSLQRTITPGAGPATNRSGTSIPDGNMVAAEGAVRISLDRAPVTITVRVNRSGNPASAASKTRIIRSGEDAIRIVTDVAGPNLQQGFGALGGWPLEGRPRITSRRHFQMGGIQ